MFESGFEEDLTSVLLLLILRERKSLRDIFYLFFTFPTMAIPTCRVDVSNWTGVRSSCVAERFDPTVRPLT